MTLLLWMIAAIIVIIGFVGLVLPALPGMVLIFCGLVVAAWAEHFVYVGWKTITCLALLMLFAWLIDLLSGKLGAKKFGAGQICSYRRVDWSRLWHVFWYSRNFCRTFFWSVYG
jgi:uncharacterized protein YqgC (DUF456 family)